MRAGRVPINILPDDVLLLIFHFDRVLYLGGRYPVEPSWRWRRLVHVCRRWRSVIFASPNFLHLTLVCGPTTRLELTGIWPPFPIVIRNTVAVAMPDDYDFDAAIVRPDRVCEISLHNLTRLQLERLASAMQEEFPALVHLKLGAIYYIRRTPLPDGFLGESAPRLQSLELDSIALPTLPNLLLSTTHLVRLILKSIPHSGYFSPEAIVTRLAGLVNLENLTIEFESSLSRPPWETPPPPPPTRAVLPALTRLEFRGVSEYLEEFVSRIDAPLLDSIWMTFFRQFIYEIPQLAQFMRRTTRFEVFNEAHIDLDDIGVLVASLPPTRAFDEKSGLRILDWRISLLTQTITSFFPSIYMVEHLYVYRPRYFPSQWQDDSENMQWLEIFQPFTAVKKLYVSWQFAQCIAPALQKLVGERVINVLPALECLFLQDLQPSGPVREAIGRFVAARQLLGHPVAVFDWDRTRELEALFR